MKALRILAILLLTYVGIVVAFESLLGYFQPAGETTMVITTTDSEGIERPRVVARLNSNDQLYVAANHWPRSWYREARANPQVVVTLADSEPAEYVAVLVEGAEYDRVDAENPLGPVIRFLTGYPPRKLMRLDPLESPGQP